MMVAIWEPTESGAPISISSIGRIDEINANNVHVNGVKFDISRSEMTFDGSAGGVNDLYVGQVVTVVGILNEDGRSGVAKTVAYETGVLDPVDFVLEFTPGF